MICPGCSQRFNDSLDQGGSSLLGQAIRTCPTCAALADSLDRVTHCLRLVPAAVPPPGLADRLTTSLLGEHRRHRRQRRLRFVAVASLLAASVMLAVGIAFWPGSPRPEAQPRDPAPVVNKTPNSRPTKPLRESMAQASSAMTSLTAKTAEATMGETASLLPLMGASFETPLPTDSLPRVQPLQEASEGVSAGLAPVADSARRAFGMMLRDLPLGKGSTPEKPS